MQAECTGPGLTTRAACRSGRRWYAASRGWSVRRTDCTAADPEQTLAIVERNHRQPLPLESDPGKCSARRDQIPGKRNLPLGRWSAQGQECECADDRSKTAGHGLFLSDTQKLPPTRIDTHPLPTVGTASSWASKGLYRTCTISGSPHYYTRPIARLLASRAPVS